MLVDLARNDINRICTPESNKVDRLLTIERFSHVMHLVSEVSGTLRDWIKRGLMPSDLFSLLEQ